jgi:hypothetical protein
MYLITHESENYQYLADSEDFLAEGERAIEASCEHVSLDEILEFIDDRYEAENWHGEVGVAREIADVITKRLGPQAAKMCLWDLIDVLKPN